MIARRVWWLLAFLSFALIIYIGHPNSWQQFPNKKHAWTQADRYALALGYQSNGFNLFFPETFCYTKQFSAQSGNPSPSTVTAVDLPWNEYLIALLMKVTGRNGPEVYRGLSFIWLLLGLVFFWNTALIVGIPAWQAWIITFCLSQVPVFFFYQDALLSCITALSLLLIATNFWVRFFYQDKKWPKLYAAAVFLLLAALLRSSCLIPFIAFAATSIWFTFRTKDRIKGLLPWLLSIGVWALWQGHQKQIKQQFGSLFLSEWMPARSWDELLMLIPMIWQNVAKIYFVPFALLLAIVVAFGIKRYSFRHPLLLLSGIASAGAIALFLLVMRQYVVHDYYFIDTFIWPLSIGFIYAWSKWQASFLRSALAFLAFVFVANIILPKNIKKSKSDPFAHTWDRTARSIVHFEESAAWLDACKVPRDARILVWDACTPNIPFIFMQRKGFPVIETSGENLAESLFWPFDYLVLQPFFALQEQYQYPDSIWHGWEHVASNGRLVLLKRAEKAKSSLETLIFNNNIRGYEYIWNGYDYVLNNDSIRDFEMLLSTDEYLYVMEVPMSMLGTFSAVYLSYIHLAQQPLSGEWAISISRNDTLMHFDRIDLAAMAATADKKNFSFVFTPVINISGPARFKLYYWNKFGDPVALSRCSVRFIP